jgi:hypothetical protein
MVSKYSLLFDVKFQSMFSIPQKKAAEVVDSHLIIENPDVPLKEKTSTTQALAPVKD